MVEPPRILDIRADWKLGWGNSPGIRVLLSEHRFQELSLIYEMRENLYYAEHGAVVHFLYHSGTPTRQDGFGGRTSTLTMKDGSIIELIGPWSSNAGNANRLGFGPCMEATYTDRPGVMKIGYTFIGGSLLVSAVQAWLDEHPEADWYLHEHQSSNSNTLGGDQLQAVNAGASLRNPTTFYTPRPKQVIGKVACGRCKGTGQMLDAPYPTMYSGTIECDKCGGTGEAVSE